MKYRLIPLETHTAAMNMALDEACMEAVKTGESLPTIRIYKWKPAAVSIGYFQCLTDEIDVEACKQDGISIVRRQTGGGAVYHDKELTYSIITPEKEFSSDINKSYQEICTVIVKALGKLGVKAAFRPINDITAEGRKISGNAQVRKNGVLLQHGTILLSIEPDKMFKYLIPDKAKISDKPFTKSVKSAVVGLDELSKQGFYEPLKESFKNTFICEESTWIPEEQETATVLAREKYGHESWNAMR